MATKIDTYDFKARGTNKYPWAEWTDGNIWRLKKGEDFNIKLSSMRSICKIHAKRKGFELRTGSPEQDVLVVQFVNSEKGA